MRYRVWQIRWIKDSDQNFKNVIWEGTRIKEARGQCKSNLNSHMEMLIKHEMIEEYEDAEVDYENYSITFFDLNGPIYSCRYEVEEVND